MLVLVGAFVYQVVVVDMIRIRAHKRAGKAHEAQRRARIDASIEAVRARGEELRNARREGETIETELEIDIEIGERTEV